MILRVTQLGVSSQKGFYENTLPCPRTEVGAHWGTNGLGREMPFV